jgi:hypothetical protein
MFFNRDPAADQGAQSCNPRNLRSEWYKGQNTVIGGSGSGDCKHQLGRDGQPWKKTARWDISLQAGHTEYSGNKEDHPPGLRILSFN